ncbi:MAG TPA: PD-(D/E)XK nuclease family protein [Opitutaceae bacterium]|nr:PD-(D/E)XK nuclease family protein [Opitutaceae bacterium]
MPIRRHFLPWGRPLLPQAVEWLAGEWKGDGPLDLARQVVIVPTGQSGRRLREALAEFAAEKRQAVFAPRTMTPDGLLAAPANTASRLQTLLAWTSVFRGLELNDFRQVFPVDPPARNFSWALRLADQFAKLQAQLAEGGLLLGGVAAKAGDFPEAARWRQLGELEARHAARLAALGLTEPQAAKIAGAAAPAPLGADRIVLIGVADPLPLALRALEAHARTAEVAILVFAPPSEADSFDDWGRPRTERWERRGLPLADFEARVRLCADPSDQAERVAALAVRYGSPTGRLALAVADAEILPPLEAALERARLPAFNPEGRLRRGDRLHQLARSLGDLAREPSFDAVAALARCPDFLEFLGGRLGGDFSPAHWLEGLDELRSRHLPAGLAAARARAAELGRHPELLPGLDEIEELRRDLAAEDFATGASRAFARLFSGRRFNLADPAEARLQDSARAWMDLVRECGAAGERLAPSDAWELALRLYGEGRRTEEKPAHALELQGWLELLYEDAPHVAVAGLNDGIVPDAVTGDAFLPEALRRALGLKTNGARLARDAYLLAAADACRGPGGRLDLLLGKVSAAEDPLRPSRLLLLCPDEELPRRVKFLFRGLDALGAGPAWRRAWRLRRPEAAPFVRLRVTDFREYLRCPYRFFLRHALRLSPFDPAKSELDSADFGTLCHGALEAMAKEPALRDCTDPALLRQCLHEALERQVRARYGAELSLPLQIQVDSARQRLGQAARVQAEARAEGWVLVQAERPFALKVGPLWVDGKADRIDRHEATGRVRVLDYKSADRPIAPAEAHAAARGRRAEAPDFARFRIGQRELVWTDLQLPLYLAALEPELGEGAVPGYFNLPKATGDTAIETWEGYDGEWRAAARRCAEGVTEAIAAGRFWPPAEIPERDDALFAGWFHHGTADSVEPAEAAR